MIALSDANCQKALGDPVYLVIEFPPGPVIWAIGILNRLVVWVKISNLLQQRANCDGQ